MPVAFKSPSSSPLPAAATAAAGSNTAPTGAAPLGAASGASPGTAGTPAGSFNFLTLLANMNALAAHVLPSSTADTAPVAASAASESAELTGAAKPTGKKPTDAETDPSTPQDEALLAAMALSGLPIPAPSQSLPQVTGTADTDKDTSSDAILGALTGAQGDGAQAAGTSSSDSALSLTPQVKPQDLVLPTPTTAAATAGAAVDTLLKTDALTASDADPTSAPSTSASSFPSHLQALAGQAPPDLNASTPREIRAPVGTHAWTHQVGDEIAWMMQQGSDAASLKLSPEHLGPLEVKISMQDGAATIWFGAAHSDTRSALEQALPRLREMFASQGLSLANAGVFKEAPRQQNRAPAFSSGSGAREAATEISPTSRSALITARLLDTYA